jgi:PAS domain S-box-containing protein
MHLALPEHAVRAWGGETMPGWSVTYKLRELRQRVAELQALATSDPAQTQSNLQANLQAIEEEMAREGSRVAGVEGLLTDVTERKRLEEEIVRAKEYLGTVFDSIPDAIVAVDMNRTVVDCNRSVETVFGYRKEEIVGKNSALFYPDRQVYDEIERTVIQQIREKGYFRGEIAARHKQGTRLSLDVSASLLKGAEQQPVGIVGVFRDMTEHKRAEQALKKSEEKYRVLVENADEAIFSVDCNGVFLFMNGAAARDLGGRREDLVGKTMWDLVPQEVVQRHVQTIQEVIETGQGKVEEREMVLAGRRRWYRTNCQPLMDESGQPCAVIVMGTDVSERRQREEELQQYAWRLETLRRMDRRILSRESIDEIASWITAHVQETLPCPALSVTVFDPEAGEALVLVHRVGAESTSLEGKRFPLSAFKENEAALARLRQGELYVVENVSDLSSPLPDLQAWLGEGLYAHASAPLIVEEDLIGTLNLTVEPWALQTEQMDIVREIADTLAIAIHQSQLVHQVRRQAEELEKRVSARTRELATLYEITAVTSKPMELGLMLDEVLKCTVEAMGSSAGSVHVVDDVDGEPGNEALCLVAHCGLSSELQALLSSVSVDRGIIARVLKHNEPLIITDLTPDAYLSPTAGMNGFRVYGGAPMRARGRTLGVLSVFGDEAQQLAVDDIALLASIADHAGVAVENDRLRKQAERAAIAQERERLARELHDAITQSLYSLTLFADAAQDRVRDHRFEEVSPILDEIVHTGSQALKEMRLMLYELRPSLLRDHGLIEALHRRLDTVEARVGIEGRILDDALPELPAPAEEAFFSIAQEALNNALKHAEARSVTIRVCLEGEYAVLEIRDDGRGFDPEMVGQQGGQGLVNMKERAAGVGGSLTILSVPEGGTTVKVSLKCGS